jgi:hypothetical protein
MRKQCQAITGSVFARNSRSWPPATALLGQFCPK